MKYLLVLSIALSSFCYFDSTFADGINCRNILAPLLSDEMQGFWKTLNAAEQEAVAKTIKGFWTHHLRRSDIPLAETLPVFAGLMQHTLTGNYSRWPEKWDRAWLIQFFDEILKESNTTASVSAVILSLKTLLPD